MQHLECPPRVGIAQSHLGFRGLGSEVSDLALGAFGLLLFEIEGLGFRV